MKREEVWDKLKVKDIRDLIVKDSTVIHGDLPVLQLLEKFNEDLRTRHVYVVDAKNHLIGVVRMNDIVRFLFPYASIAEEGTSVGWEMSLNLHFAGFTSIEDDDLLLQPVSNIMNDEPYYVEENTMLSDMAQILIREKINELPVVDSNRKIIGQVNVCEAIHAFLDQLKK